VREAAPLGRQPNSVPFVLGGRRRLEIPVPAERGWACVYPGSCRTHLGVHSAKESSLSASRHIRVRGNPPSGFIPRPYMSSTGGRSSLYSPPAPATHDAMVFLFGNVMTVFNA